MENNQGVHGYKYLTGYCDFENYWGEKLVTVEFTHFVSGLIDKYEKYGTYKTIHNVPDKAKLEGIFPFRYSVGAWDSYDHWIIKIITESIKYTKVKDDFIVH